MSKREDKNKEEKPLKGPADLFGRVKEKARVPKEEEEQEREQDKRRKH